jgi:hypothetical protein
LRCDLELGQIFPVPAIIWEAGEVDGLRTLFGRGAEGVEELLGRLRAGERLPLPQGVTPETLEKYREVAEGAIQRGIDLVGTRQGRLEAVDILPRQLGLR